MKHWERSLNTDYENHWHGVNANREFMSFIAKDIDSGTYFVMLEFDSRDAQFTASVAHAPMKEVAVKKQHQWLENHDPIESGDLESYLGM